MPRIARRSALSRHSLSELIAFYLLFAVVAGLAFWLVHSYLDIIAFSLTAVIVLKPLYDRVLRWVGGRVGLAVGLTICAFFLAVIVPLAIALSIVAGQATSILSSVGPGADLLSRQQIDQLMAFISGLNLPFGDQIQQWLLGAASQAASVLATFVLGIGASIPDLISRFFIFLGIVGALLPNYHRFVRRLKRLSPLDDGVDDLFLHRIKLTVWSMFMGIFVIAVAQGLVTGLLFWISGVPYSPLLTLVAVVASMFPLGASLVAVPVGIVLLVVGNYPGAAIVLLGYFLIVSNIDSILRPRLVSKEAYLSFALVLLSALGGYELFGFFGVVYGPVLMILFLTVLEVYETYYAEDDQPLPPEVAPEMADGAGENTLAQ
ncbi:MAG TPA: AI-2E family transporter [Roseiflexaceae bacterium]|nr:AI-2E family transporter [Roseiflexaceae bacterium]